MTYKLNPFTGKLDTSDGPQGPAGVVSAAGPGSQGTPSISFAADLDTGLYNYTANGIAVSTGGTGRLFIDASGSVGVGYASPSNFAGGDLGAIAPLVVGDGTGGRNVNIFSADNNYGHLAFSDGTSGSSTYAGLIQYYHANDSMAFYTGSSLRMSIDSSGRLGLGTTSPSTRLDLVESGATALYQRFQNANGICYIGLLADGNTVISANTTGDQIIFETEAVERARITSDGKLGLGTSSPGARLSVLSADNVAATTIADFGANNGTSAIQIGYNRITQVNSTPASAYLQLGVSNKTDALFIDGSGNVGIGTASPALKLHAEDSTQQIVRWTRTGVGAGSLDVDASGNAVLNAHTTSTGIAFHIQASEKARITSDGKLGLGTSSVASLLHLASSGPVLTLQRSDSASPGCAIHFTNSTGGVNWQIGTNQAVGGSAFEINAGNQSNNKFVITSGGAVGIGTTSPSVPLQLGASASNGYVIFDDGTNARISMGGTTSAATLYASTTGFAAYEDLEIRSAATIFKRDGTNESARLDGSGRLLVGTSTAVAVGGESNPKLQLVDAGATSASWFNLARFVDSVGSSAIQFGKSRGSTVGDYTIVQSGDTLGVINFAGSDGTDLGSYGAQIKAEVDGTPGVDDMPGRLVFSTTADGASSPTERMRITSDAYIRLAAGSGGIQFGGDTAAANALDDYEEGTYTMTLYDNITGGNASPTTATVKYTKIGRLVHVYGLGVNNIDTTGMTAGNNLYVSLPFTVGEGYSGGEARLLGAALPSSGQSTNATLGAGSGARFTVGVFSNAGGVVAATVGDLTSGVSDLRYISIVYQAA